MAVVNESGRRSAHVCISRVRKLGTTRLGTLYTLSSSILISSLTHVPYGLTTVYTDTNLSA